MEGYLHGMNAQEVAGTDSATTGAQLRGYVSGPVDTSLDTEVHQNKFVVDENQSAGERNIGGAQPSGARTTESAHSTGAEVNIAQKGSVINNQMEIQQSDELMSTDHGEDGSEPEMHVTGRRDARAPRQEMNFGARRKTAMKRKVVIKDSDEEDKLPAEDRRRTSGYFSHEPDFMYDQRNPYESLQYLPPAYCNVTERKKIQQ